VTSQQCMAASHSGSVDTSPTVATAVTSTTATTATAAACNVMSWSSRDVQLWLHSNDLDSLADRFLIYSSSLHSGLALECTFCTRCSDNMLWADKERPRGTRAMRPGHAPGELKSVSLIVRCIVGPCGVWGPCRISPPRFLAECRKRRLNQGSFVYAVCLVVCLL